MNEIEKERVAAVPTQIILATVCHPMEYAKVLIQLGYEPIAPRPSTTLFGRPAMVLPNVFQYIKYIKSSDGFVGCYTGLSARIMGILASAHLSTKIVNLLGLSWSEMNDPPNIYNEDEAKIEVYARLLRRDLVLHAATIVVSYPFHVVSVRMMAAFVGKEQAYQTVLSAFKAVYIEDGVMGFFSGIVPKMLADLTCTAVTLVLAYVANRYFVKSKEMRAYTVPVLTFITSTVTYPLAVVSTCMAVGTKMAVASPPHSPRYDSWRDCWRQLVRAKQHKRGSSLIFRYYIAPVHIDRR